MSDLAASAPPAEAPTPSKGLNIGLWIAQVVLGAMFGMAGVIKSTTPFAELAQQMPWVPVMGETMTRFIGISEFLGGVGLLLPALTRIKPVLTAWAGAGLTVVMLLAAGYHVVHSEWSVIPINLVLGGIAAFIAWGRFRAAPIAPRS